MTVILYAPYIAASIVTLIIMEAYNVYKAHKHKQSNKGYVNLGNQLSKLNIAGTGHRD